MWFQNALLYYTSKLTTEMQTFNEIFTLLSQPDLLGKKIPPLLIYIGQWQYFTMVKYKWTALAWALVVLVILPASYRARAEDHESDYRNLPVSDQYVAIEQKV